MCGIGDLWRTWIISNWVQVILLIIQDQFYIIQNLQNPLFHKPVTDQELFFSVSYSKPALPTISQHVIIDNLWNCFPMHHSWFIKVCVKSIPLLQVYLNWISIMVWRSMMGRWHGYKSNYWYGIHWIKLNIEIIHKSYHVYLNWKRKSW